MRKKYKKLLIVTCSVVAFVIAVILFISPAAKYLIEKYDIEFSGREISIGWVYINPFTGYLHFSDISIYELNSNNIFIKADGISASISMWQLISGNYEISKLTLKSPKTVIIQKGSSFNFDDLLIKFSTQDSSKTGNSTHLSILNVFIVDGEFQYVDKLLPIDYGIKEFNLESSGFRWNVDSISAHYAFKQTIGKGDIDGEVMIDLKSSNYRMDVLIKTFDLNIFEQYLGGLVNYGSFKGILDANLKAAGNLKAVEQIIASGFLNLSDFHFGKSSQNDFVSFENLNIAIKEVSTQNQVFAFDSISVLHPCFKYEKYDHLDNFQTMFGENGSNIDSAQVAQFNIILEIAEYIKSLTKNFFQSDFNIGRLAVYNAEIKYIDYSLSEKFSIDLNPLTVLADSIDKDKDRANISLHSKILPYGNIIADLSINPKDSSDFDLLYNINGLPAPLFNPFIISNTSFPLDRGTIELNGEWNVRNGIIKSDNHLVIIDPRISKRVKNDDLDWLPIRPIMALVRERGNVIDYKIPIQGNLADPRFRVNDVIFDILENIFVKPASTSYISEVRKTEKQIENSLTLTWDKHDIGIDEDEESFLKRTAEYLVDNPWLSITVYPYCYESKEKEQILLYEVKKMYYLSSNRVSKPLYSEADSVNVKMLSFRDSSFKRYLDYQVDDSLIFNVQEKSGKLVSAASVNKYYQRLNHDRENNFMALFKDRNVDHQVTIKQSTESVPYNGFSYYRIEYKGELPGGLLKAYQKINEFNQKAPRKKFKLKRSNIPTTL